MPLGSYETYAGPVDGSLTAASGVSGSDGNVKASVVQDSTGLDYASAQDAFNSNDWRHSVASSPSKSAGANSYYYDLYMKTGNYEYLEKYIDNLIAQENTNSARDWQERMSNTEWSRAFQDIKNAGYNPWLLLNSGSGGSSAGSTSAAGHISSSASAKIKDRDKAYSQMVIGLITSALMAMAIAL